MKSVHQKLHSNPLKSVFKKISNEIELWDLIFYYKFVYFQN